MKSTKTPAAHEIDLAPIRAALEANDKAMTACIDNEKAIEDERSVQNKSIDEVALEDLESQTDYVLDEAKRSVRIRIREGHHAKLCAARRAAATELMCAFLDLSGAVTDSASREMWELKAKIEEVLQPVIIRYNRAASMYLAESWHLLLSPYQSFIDSIGALDVCSEAEDRENRHGFYKARSAMLIKTVEDFNKRGVWFSPEREPAV